MLKAMLVDDEPLTIRMLKSLIDWGKYGIEISDTALDGLEALGKFQLLRPDIIITDIKMPRLDGIEFIKRVREISPSTELILVSAHADFDYVKEALKLGCSDYILKPIDENELESALKKIISKISGQNDVKRLLAKSEQQKREHALKNYMKTDNGLHGLQKQLGDIASIFSCYLLLRINISNETINEYDHLSDAIHEQMSYAMRRMDELLSKYGAHTLLECEDDTWFAILSEVPPQQAADCANELILLFAEDFQCRVTVCFTRPVRGLAELPLLYKKLLLLGRYSFYRGGGDVLGYGYNCKEEDFDSLEPIAQRKSMAEALEGYRKEEATQILNHVLSEQISPSLLDGVYEFCYETLLHIRRLLPPAENPGAGDSFANTTYRELSEIAPLEHLRDFMSRAICSLPDSCAGSPTQQTGRLVRQGIKILGERYVSNISLEDICSEIAVSKNYFCYLFKKETGKNIWAYLTEIRMDKAKELLKATELKSYEIAYAIGYDNPSYFSKTFKKLYGMTPNEFRAAQQST